MAKRHHSSKKHHSKRHGHHLSHAESEHMLSMKHGHHADRHHTDMGHPHHPTHHMHPRHAMKRKYDSVEHRSNMYNDQYRHDADRQEAGLYNYDRQRPSDISENRRYKEMFEAGMIHEDHRAVANLPQEVRYNPYPQAGGYTPEDLDDTLRGIDRQMDYDNTKKMDHFYPKKH